VQGGATQRPSLHTSPPEQSVSAVQAGTQAVRSALTVKPSSHTQPSPSGWEFGGQSPPPVLSGQISAQVESQDELSSGMQEPSESHAPPQVELAQSAQHTPTATP